jgi:post-segregation antitoxin (ccd killing protein)
MALAVRQISITLEEDLLQCLDQWGGNRSAAIAEAVRQWRDQQWQRSLAEAYAALDEAGADRSANPSPPDALIAAREAAELARSPS